MVPGKVPLRQDLIQRAPCYTTPPSSDFMPKHTSASRSMHGHHTKRAVRCNCCGCNYYFAMIDLLHICKQPQLQCSASETAMASKQHHSRWCNPKQGNPMSCNTKQHKCNSRQNNARQCNFMLGNAMQHKVRQGDATQLQRNTMQSQGNAMQCDPKCNT